MMIKICKLIPQSIFLLLFVITIHSCSESVDAESTDPHYINLADGFYFLNGKDLEYMVKRDIESGGRYIFNPKPIFANSDYASIDVLKEDNGAYSLSFNLQKSGADKWEEVLKTKAHYIGFVNNNKFKSLLKIKGDNSSDELYVRCVSGSKIEAEEVKEKLLPKD